MNRGAAEIFHEAREMAPERRAGYLVGACGKDLALRATVEALLKADAELGRFMASPSVDVPSSQEQAGAQVGRYKLLEQIGEGGMGTIWMAEQREPVKRRVALKIIKLGMDTKQVIARFEAERQALALMDHPHIAKVLDAGATDTGRPYFVMEYIKGIPILEYCDTERLDTKARLDLFINVCHAIQHAHQKGIIHRDIKPSNILVTLHDGVPVPKVIDFGIAKATNSELTTKTLFTEHRQLVGTPSYMSPEQAEMSGLDIDTRSDIYSLGVLLYELLTGTTPFDMKELLSKGFAEMMRVIREDEPHKPSTRISTLGDTATRAAQQRRADVKKLGRLLRGDLDWVVMKCLEKDRTRRYETANGLAADIDRHLNDEPVAAGPPTAAYKLRKFVMRNRGQVIAAGGVLVALLIGVIAFAWQAEEARLQRDIAVLAQQGESKQRRLADEQRSEAEEQRKTAETERDKAELIATFMSDTLQGAGPSVAKGRDITMLKEMMDAAAARIEKGDLRAVPEAELRLRATIGGTYRELAVFDAAQGMLQPALALARATHIGDDETTANALINLAALLRDQGDLSRAEPLFRESLDMTRRLFPGDHPDVANGLNNLATLLQSRGDLAGAEPFLREALEMWKRLVPGEHPDVARGLNTLASVLQARGDLAGAEPLHRESLEIWKRLFPGDHPELARGLNNLASLLQDRGDLAGAEPLSRESLEMTKRLFSGDHPEVAGGLHNLANLLQARGDLRGAEQLYRESLEMWKRLFPRDHPDVATGLSNLGVLLYVKGDLAGAEALYRESLEILKRLFPGDHPNVAAGLNNLANLLQARGDLAGAEPLYRQSVEMQKRLYSGDHPDMAMGLHCLASVLSARGDLVAAEPLYRESLEMWKRIFPGDHPDVATGLNGLAGLLHTRGDLAGAEPLMRESLEMRKRIFPGDHPDVAASLISLANLLKNRGDLAGAEPIYRESLEMTRRLFPGDNPNVATALDKLARLLGDRGDLTAAEPLMLEALEMRQRLFQSDHPDLLAIKSNLAALYVKQGKPEKSLPLIMEVLEASRATLPKDSPQLAGQIAQLGGMLAESKAWSEAEPLIREALGIREKTQPDAWTTFNSKSMLGGVLLGQNKLAEAEPLLLDGYRGMRECESSIPWTGKKRVPEALERLVRLYEAKGDATEAAAWRAKLEAERAKLSNAPSQGDKR